MSLFWRIANGVSLSSKGFKRSSSDSSLGMKVLAFSLISSCSLICAPASFCQDEHSNNKKLLKKVRVLDGLGNAYESQTVQIHGGLIYPLYSESSRLGGPLNRSEFGKDDVLDLSGYTLVPGIISAHTHVGQYIGTTNSADAYTRENVLDQLKLYQSYGVTTVAALGLNRAELVDFRKAIRDGSASGADILTSDHGLGAPGGTPGGSPPRLGPDQLDNPATPEEARAAVAASKSRGADIIKIWVDSSGGRVPKMKPEVYAAIIDEAHQHNLKVAAHIFALEDAKDLIRKGVDIIAHGVRDQPVDDEFINLMKEHQVWYIATLALDDAAFVYADRPDWYHSSFFRRALSPELAKEFDNDELRDKKLASPQTASRRENLDMNKRNLTILYEAGVNIAFGTDSGAFPERVPGFAEHREIMLMAESQIPPAEIVKIATSNSAKALGLTDRGIITSGMKADFVIFKGQPDRDHHDWKNIHEVWRGGVKVWSATESVPELSTETGSPR